MTSLNLKPSWMEYVLVPFYNISLRERYDGDFQTGLITKIPLAIGETSAEEARRQAMDLGSLSKLECGNGSKNFWVKRGVAIVCQKEE